MITLDQVNEAINTGQAISKELSIGYNPLSDSLTTYHDLTDVIAYFVVPAPYHSYPNINSVHRNISSISQQTKIRRLIKRVNKVINA